MKTKTRLLLFAIVTLIIASCKKGAEDPSFSLRTRKNRVVGDWHMKSGRSTYQETNTNGSISYSEGITFTQTSYTYTTGSGASTGIYAGGHIYNITFEKQGDVLITEIFDGLTNTYKGKWNFNGNVGEAKAKEEIIVHLESFQNFNGLKTYKGNNTDMTFTLIELRNKKIKMRSEYNVTNPDGTGYKYVDDYELIQ